MDVFESEIVYHGIEWSDYFQGCGTAFTEFTACFTGIGNNPHEALEDALEQAAMAGWDVENVPNNMPETPEVEAGEDESPWYHVSIRLR